MAKDWNVFTVKVFLFVGSVIIAVVIVAQAIFNLVYSPLACGLIDERKSREQRDDKICADIFALDYKIDIRQREFIKTIAELTVEVKNMRLALDKR